VSAADSWRAVFCLFLGGVVVKRTTMVHSNGLEHRTDLATSSEHVTLSAMEGVQPGAVLPPGIAALLELAAERMGLGKGDPGGLELSFGPDGTLRKWRRFEEGGRDRLGSHDEEPDADDG